MRVGIAALTLLLIGCPNDRHDQTTRVGSFVPLPPAMEGPPPPANGLIGDLRAPESVLHDTGKDLYYIANINGSMQGFDNNGFISRVHPETLVTELTWIEGGKNGVTLHAPKGMALVGDTLYVADINVVRKFDRRTGAPRGEIAIPKATFLNDIAADGNTLYVSDTGIILGPGTRFYASGTDAIWKIENDRPTRIAHENLGHPNGLDVIDGALWVVTFGGDELYRLAGTSRRDVRRMPAGQLDGVTHLADGTQLVTSWQGDEIYRENGRGAFTAILAGLDSPADIAYDAKRGRLLVPHPGGNQVSIHPVR
jgi:hypothetical protein